MGEEAFHAPGKCIGEITAVVRVNSYGPVNERVSINELKDLVKIALFRTVSI
jgi:hypothetical protein